MHHRAVLAPRRLGSICGTGFPAWKLTLHGHACCIIDLALILSFHLYAFPEREVVLDILCRFLGFGVVPRGILPAHTHPNKLTIIWTTSSGNTDKGVPRPQHAHVTNGMLSNPLILQ